MTVDLTIGRMIDRMIDLTIGSTNDASIREIDRLPEPSADAVAWHRFAALVS